MTGTTRRPAEAGAELLEALHRAGVEDVDDSGLARALYSSDGSLYRVLPRAVVRPRHPDEIVATLEVCRSLGIPLTARGAGTSIAGNAVGPGVVVDTSRHLDRVRDIDPEARLAVVDPGVVQAALQARARPHGLRFGPDPSTSNRCTIGGMIGNNACGSRALGYGRTSDNVVGLDVVTGSGARMRLGPRDGRPPRRRPARLRRWSSTPTSARSAPSWAGSGARCPATPSSTCCPSAASTWPGRWSAARARSPSSWAPPCAWYRAVEAVPRRAGLPLDGRRRRRDTGVLPHRPTACEGLDSRIVAACARRARPRSSPTCPVARAGWSWSSWATTPTRLAARAVRVVAGSGALDNLVVTDPPRRRRSGASARTARAWRHAPVTDAPPTPAGRTRPSRSTGSGAYLREFEELLGSTTCRACPTGTSATGASTSASTSPSAPSTGRRRPRRVPRVRPGRRRARGPLRRVAVG